MKTVIITCSPKKHHNWSNSYYAAYLTSKFLKDVEIIPLKGVKDYKRIDEACLKADALVIATPLFVDSIPATLLRFLKDNEQTASKWNLKVYIISCCGFYEGEQTNIQLSQLKYWCDKVKLEYAGGLGVGATEMLGAIRFTNLFACIPMGLLTALLVMLFTFNPHKAFISGFISFLIPLCLYSFWSIGLYFNTYKLAKNIKTNKCFENIYTSVTFCPRFLFVFFASLFWIIRAMKNGISYKKMFEQIKIEDLN